MSASRGWAVGARVSRLVLALATLSACVGTTQDLGESDDAGAAVADAAITRALVALAAGRRTTMVVEEDGTVWAWGAGGNGQLAVSPESLTETCTIPPGTTACADVPVRVPALAGAQDVSLGMEHGCALRAGRVVCWGLNLIGALGDGTTRDDPGPVPVDVGIDDAIAVASGDWHSCAIHEGGGVSCWGLGAAACALSPRRVPGLAGARALALGRGHTCALLTSGDVVCFGSSELGELGHGTTAGSVAPVLATSGASAITAGSHHTCATIAGGLSCWGVDDLAQAGIASPPSSCGPYGCVLAPTALPSFGSGPPLALGAGDAHTCVVAGTEAWCFGDAARGAVGPSTASCPAGACVVPAAAAASGVRGPIAGGTDHTCVAVSDASLACFGNGDAGQLGDGRRSSSTAAVRVTLP